MKKLLYINNFEAPYRVPFYNGLGSYFDMILLLSRPPERVMERNKKWFYTGDRKYKLEYSNGVFQLIKLIRYINKSDIIFLDMYGTLFHVFAIIYMKVFGIPFILSVDGMLPKKNEFCLKRIFKKYLINAAQIVLSPNEFTDCILFDYGLQKEKIERYHFTSILNEYVEKNILNNDEKVKLRKYLNLPSQVNDKIILTVGRFANGAGFIKGYDILFGLWHDLPDNYYLVVVGGEPDSYFSEMLDNINNHRIIIVNHKSALDLKRYYRCADLFVLQTRHDVWGLVINEAMANALPVITTDMCVSGHSLVKDGVNGYIVGVNDVVELEAKIKSILATDLFKKMGLESLKIISNWTIENMISEHIRILNKFKKNNEISNC